MATKRTGGRVVANEIATRIVKAAERAQSETGRYVIPDAVSLGVSLGGAVTKAVCCDNAGRASTKSAARRQRLPIRLRPEDGGRVQAGQASTVQCSHISIDAMKALRTYKRRLTRIESLYFFTTTHSPLAFQ